MLKSSERPYHDVTRGDWAGEMRYKQRADPLRIQASVHPDLNLGSQAVEERDEGVRARGRCHSLEMVVVRGKGGMVDVIC